MYILVGLIIFVSLFTVIYVGGDPQSCSQGARDSFRIKIIELETENEELQRNMALIIKRVKNLADKLLPSNAPQTAVRLRGIANGLRKFITDESARKLLDD